MANLLLIIQPSKIFRHQSLFFVDEIIGGFRLMLRRVAVGVDVVGAKGGKSG
ncbi:MAG: hypothetical protein MR850_02090 [Bacteroidales bacterium]|nr:hypothetical protein [Bacteroidales bacterium]